MPKPIRLATMLVGVVSLAACHADMMDLGPVAPHLPPAYPRTGVSPAPAQAAGSVSWWKSFGDPTLDALLANTQTRNPTLAQAEQRLNAARALARSASAGFSPGAGLSGLANAGTGKATRDDLLRRPAQLNLETGWEVALFGQDRLSRELGQLEVEAAASDESAAHLAISAEIASTYAQLRALQQHQSDAQAMVALLSRSQDLAETKLRAGLGTSAEAASLRPRLAAAIQRKRELDDAVQNALQRIATLLGTATIDPNLARAGRQPVAPGFAIDSRPADLLRLRPDVRRAELAVLQAGAELGLAQADLYPKLHLSGMIGLGTPVSGSLFGVMGGPSLQVPVFDSGRRRDVVVARGAQLEEARAAYRQAVLTAYEEAAAALRALQTVRENTRQVRSAFDAASRSQGSADLLLREGLSDASGAITGRLAAIELRGQLVDAIAEEAQALIRSVKATGGAPVAAPATRPPGRHHAVAGR